MPKYNGIAELPPQVRAILSESRQEYWRECYNLAIESKADNEQALRFAWMYTFKETLGESVEIPAFKDGENYSFVSTVEGMKFETTDDGFIESWVQMLPLGKYHHAVYGEINVTPERIARFAANVNNNVRGTQLDIDYEHKENPTEGGRAAGWVQQAEARPDGLWARIRWTPRAANAIKSGEYKYISPEFADSWEHPKSKEKFDDVLFGGGITNRPFLKDILPLNLSEIVTEFKTPEKDPQEGREMALLEALRKQFNLSDDATEEQALEALTTALKATTDLQAAVAELRSTVGLDEKGDLKGTVKALHEFKLENSKEDEHAKKFAEMFPEEAKQMEELRQAKKLSEVTAKLTEWTKNPKSKIGIPTKLHDEIKEYRLSLDGEAAEGFDKVIDRLVEVGTVSFSEKGSSETPDGEEQLAEGAEQFISKVEEVMKENDKLTFGEAVKVATAKHPKLAEAYANAQPTISSAGGE